MHKTIYTIGHSTRALEEFISMLHSFKVEVLADIRSFPGSRRYPHFNKEQLGRSLTQNNISYIHLPDLGGRRKPQPDSHNTVWRNAAFRGYADYMETEPFKKAIRGLEDIARKQTVAYMCSEAVWWRCHRSIVSDYLKSQGWIVMHIMDRGKATEHPYTTAARSLQGDLFSDKQ